MPVGDHRRDDRKARLASPPRTAATSSRTVLCVSARIRSTPAGGEERAPAGRAPARAFRRRARGPAGSSPRAARGSRPRGSAAATPRPPAGRASTACRVSSSARLPLAGLLERAPVRPEGVGRQDVGAGLDVVAVDREDERRRLDQRPRAPERQLRRAPRAARARCPSPSRAGGAARLQTFQERRSSSLKELPAIACSILKKIRPRRLRPYYISRI